MKPRRLINRPGRSIAAVTLTAMLGLTSPAALLPPADPALENWAARRVAERPGLPPLETRSPIQGVMPADPAAAALLAMDAHVAGARVTAVATDAPRALAADPDNQVWAVSFRTADGSAQEFAAHFRPDDFRPLYLRASATRRWWARISRRPRRR